MLCVKNLNIHVDKRKVLRDISLELTPGRVYALMGPNGAGKTTLLKSINQICSYTGDVLWMGSSLKEKESREKSRITTFVSQNNSVYFDFLVCDYIEMGRYCHKKTSREHVSKIIHRALTHVDAWHLRHRKITKLSSGEFKRVCIARALVTESPILLLDEPTNSLDIKHQYEIWNLLANLARQNHLIVVATHDFNMAEKYCQEMIVLKKGRCFAKGAFKQVMNKKLMDEVFSIPFTVH